MSRSWAIMLAIHTKESSGNSVVFEEIRKFLQWWSMRMYLETFINMVCEKIYLEAYINNQYICLKNNTVQLQFIFRCGSRIWSGGGPRSGTMKFADIAKRNRASEVSPIAAGGSGPAQGPRKLWGFLVFKYAFSHFLDTLF